MAFPLLLRLAVVTVLACAGLSAIASAQTTRKPAPAAERGLFFVMDPSGSNGADYTGVRYFF